jgi:gamma-glutamylcyclotransferase
MSSARMKSRTPSAKAIATGYVEGRRLTFDKVSRDGSAKCDCCASEDGRNRVHGVVYEIPVAEKDALDRAEGLGTGYAEESLKVITQAGVLDAMAYIATYKDPALKPYHWYKDLVLAGAVEHGLPAEYVESIRAIQSVGEVP